MKCRYDDDGWCIVRALYIGRGFSNPCASCKWHTHEYEDNNMRINNIKAKVAAKVAKAKAKLDIHTAKAKAATEKRTAKAKAKVSAKVGCAVALIFALCGCQNPAQRAQNADVRIVIHGGSVTFGAEFVSLAQSNETGRDDAGLAASPTNDIKPRVDATIPSVSPVGAVTGGAKTSASPCADGNCSPL